MKNEIIKSILAIAPNALRDLHDMFGMDFCAPYGAKHITGSYTVNKAIKIAKADGYTPDDFMVILSVDSEYTSRYKRLAIATVNCFGKIEVDYRTPWRMGGGLDTFYSKGDFEKVRKSERAEVYILWQRREYLKMPEKNQTDKNARYKLLKVTYGYNPSSKQKYPYNLELEKMNEKGTVISYKPTPVYTRIAVSHMTVEDVIDKSGYLVCERREDLKRRAAKRRAQREKEIFDNSDNAAKLENLTAKIAERKAEIMQELAMANTVEALTAVSESLSRWTGLAGAVYYTDQFKSRVENKKFKSVSECESEYNNILSMFDRKI